MWQSIKNKFHGLNACLAALFYGFPGKKIKIIGVTGTDGKTTTTHLIHWILTQSGKKTSMISSVYASIAGNIFDTGFHVTTPNPWVLQKLINIAVKNGDEFLILEVTSHSIDQKRISGNNFLVGVVTNVTPEHLDYHKNYEDYLHIKSQLLEHAKYAVLNKDDGSYKYLNTINKNITTYAVRNNADVTPQNFPFSTSLPGEYNIANNLAAISVCKILKIKDNIIRNAVKEFKGVKGRFELIKNNKGIRIIVDFAHTPNAFKQILPLVKSQTQGKLIHIFGCAGLRDKFKRPIMGKISAQNADIIILSEEDYRTENVNTIIDNIAQGCKQAHGIELKINQLEKLDDIETPVFFRISDRQTAIDFVFNKVVREGDTVILTGKAHEQSLCRGNKEYSWDEFKAVEKALLIN